MNIQGLIIKLINSIEFIPGEAESFPPLGGDRRRYLFPAKPSNPEGQARTANLFLPKKMRYLLRYIRTTHGD